jgi:protein ImuB
MGEFSKLLANLELLTFGMPRTLCLYLPDWSAQRQQQARDDLTDREALAELARWCDQFSPTVGLEEGVNPENLLVDVRGVATLFGGEQGLYRRVLEKFAARRLHVRAAIADTLGAAWAVAHDHWPSGETYRVIPAGKTLAALAPLPLALLRLEVETAELLNELGLRRVGQLMELPRTALEARFGPRVLLRLDQATGQAAEVIVAHHAAAELVVSWPFEYPTKHRATVDAVLEQLIGQLAARLAAQGRGALEVECRMSISDQQPLVISLGLFRPSASAEHLMGLVRLQLESLPSAGPVEELRLWVTGSDTLEWKQQEMFEGETPRDNPRHLALLVDRLSSRLGRRAVVGVRMVPDAQPELACRLVPLAGRRTNRRPFSRRVRQPIAAERPLRLYRHPLPLEVVSVVPDGAPIRFRYEQQQHVVTQYWGPERIETGWWRRPVRRDYYQIETTAAERYWLFRALADGRWFLQGTFE